MWRFLLLVAAEIEGYTASASKVLTQGGHRSPFLLLLDELDDYMFLVGRGSPQGTSSSTSTSTSSSTSISTSTSSSYMAPGIRGRLGCNLVFWGELRNLHK